MKNKPKLGIIETSENGHRKHFVPLCYLAASHHFDARVHLIGDPKHSIASRTLNRLKALRLALRYDCAVFPTGDFFISLAPVLKFLGRSSIFVVHRKSKFLTSHVPVLGWLRRQVNADVLHPDESAAEWLRAALPNARVRYCTNPMNTVLSDFPIRDLEKARAGIEDGLASLRIGILGGSAKTRNLDVLHQVVTEAHSVLNGRRIEISQIAAAEADGKLDILQVSAPGQAVSDAAFFQFIASQDIVWNVRSDTGSYFSSTALECVALGVPVITQANAWSRLVSHQFQSVRVLESLEPAQVKAAILHAAAFPAQQMHMEAMEARAHYQAVHFSDTLTDVLASVRGELESAHHG